MLDQFLSQCARNRCALAPLSAAYHVFQRTLEPGRRAAISRAAFTAALGAAGFTVVTERHRQLIVGLTLPNGAWRAEDGKLVFAEVAA